MGEGARAANAERIKDYGELRVYRSAFEAAMRIFEITKGFPGEERYSLIDQVRRSSRSVCTNIAEAWRKRRYEAHFVSKLSDAESEAEETRVWLAFALSCKYADSETMADLDLVYDRILAQLVTMISNHKIGPCRPAYQQSAVADTEGSPTRPLSHSPPRLFGPLPFPRPSARLPAFSYRSPSSHAFRARRKSDESHGKSAPPSGATESEIRRRVEDLFR